MTEDFINPFEPEDNEQDKIAKFEDLTPAAQLEQLNAVRDQFIADNREDTQRGFVEIIDISFVRQDNGKEIYIVSIRETDKETDVERERDEYYTIDAQTASLANIKQHTQQEIEQIRTYDPDMADQITEKQDELANASNSTEKISASDLERVEKAAEELGIPEEELNEADSFEVKADSVKFSADKMPSGTDSQPINGNQLLDDNTTLNNLIGKNFQYYKFIKTASGQKMIIGINKDNSFEQIDQSAVSIIPADTADIIDRNGKATEVGVVLAFKVNQYPTRAFGIYNKGAETGTFYAEGANQSGHMLGVKIDNIEPCKQSRVAKEIFEQDDTSFENTKRYVEMSKNNPDYDEPYEMLNLNPKMQEMIQKSHVSAENAQQIADEVAAACAKNPNLDFEKEFPTKLNEFAYNHDCLTAEEANKNSQQYGGQEVVDPRDYGSRQRGVNPADPHNN